MCECLQCGSGVDPVVLCEECNEDTNRLAEAIESDRNALRAQLAAVEAERDAAHRDFVTLTDASLAVAAERDAANALIRECTKMCDADPASFGSGMTSFVVYREKRDAAYEALLDYGRALMARAGR